MYKGNNLSLLVFLTAIVVVFPYPIVTRAQTTGDCCSANGTPGCDDSECETTVCDAFVIDPFCCDTAWDNFCAEEANQYCTVCGGMPQGCCQLEQSCTVTTAADCSSQGGVFDGGNSFCQDVPECSVECTDPTGPLSVPSMTQGSTTGARVAFAPVCGPLFSFSSPGVWYTVTGTGNTLTATTCNSPDPSYDTQLAVYCNGCDTLTCIDGNDDAGCGPDGVLSTVTWCSEAGATYQILVHGFSTASGDFQLDISDDGVSCSTDPQCAPIGACCSADVCSLVTADACGGGGGTYQGDGTTCQEVTCGGPGGPGSEACGEAQQACLDAIAPDNLKNKGKKVSACAHAANPYLEDGSINEECHSCIVSAVASKKKEGTNCGPAPLSISF
jgi:hypothetical protein